MQIKTIDLDNVTDKGTVEQRVMSSLKESVDAYQLDVRWDDEPEDGFLSVEKFTAESQEAAEKRWGNDPRLTLNVPGLQIIKLLSESGEAAQPFITRLKIYLGINIAERRIVQAGAFIGVSKGKKYLFAGATIPHDGKEDITVKIYTLD